MTSIVRRARQCIVVLLLACVVVSGRVQAVSLTYTVALSQHSPLPDNNTPQATLQANMKGYMSDLEEAVASKADILLYPEFGLFRPTSRTQTAQFCEEFNVTAPPSVPCNPSASGTSVVNDASCMAKNSSMYLMVNFCQKVPCSTGNAGCPSDGQFLYNTNIMFGPSGALFAIYRKSHVWLRSIYDQPSQPDLVTFDTTFGHFGMFMCFDILFSSPGPALRKQGVTSFVYDAFIPSTAIGRDAFRLWSWKNKAILLASNAAKNSGGVFVMGKQIASVQGDILIATLPANATTVSELQEFVDRIPTPVWRK